MPLPSPRSRLLVLVVAIMLVVAWCMPAAASTPEEVQEITRLINIERTSRGLRPLSIETRLVIAAQQHSDDMATRDFFSHTGSDGRDLWQRLLDVGYSAQLVGEAIAGGQSTPADVVSGWMRSDGHRMLLLHPDLAHLGVGHAYNAGATFKHYWTADVAQPGGGYTTPTPVSIATLPPTMPPPTATHIPPPTATLIPPPPTATLPAYVPPTRVPPGPSPTPLPPDIVRLMVPRLFLPDIGVSTGPGIQQR
ncbi:MAG: CAP domain-containing protein [Anaerolineae bacterium]|nr:CAP domain-containing protein [Anaerolineae bacterium]